MKKYSKRISLIIAIFAIVAMSYYIFAIFKFGQNIQDDDQGPPPLLGERPIDDDNDEPSVQRPPEWSGKERVNLLLLGLDARDANQQGYARSDTIMVLSIDPLTKTAHLFSVLRDTYAEIPGFREERINAAHAFGGPNLAMQTVGQYLDLPIHFYVSIDFEGFIALVDAIGGIEYEVERDMTHFDATDDPAYNINLKAGLQHLDGNKALQYVRFRNDGQADITRTERQRNLMKAVGKKMLTFSSLIRLPSTLEKIEPYIKTNMSLQQMWALANLGYGIKNEDIVSEQIPPPSLLRHETINDAAVITADLDKLHAYVAERLAAGGDGDAGG